MHAPHRSCSLARVHRHRVPIRTRPAHLHARPARHGRVPTRHTRRARWPGETDPPRLAGRAETVAQLSARDSTPRARTTSLHLFEHYVQLEPADAWGWLALGEARARSGQFDAALLCCDEALRRAPEARDTRIEHARLLARAGRTDRAIAAYECWLAGHAEDAEAWCELGGERRKPCIQRVRASTSEPAAMNPEARIAARLSASRRAAAPAFEPTFAHSEDSDGNSVTRIGAGADMAVSNRTRLGVALRRTHVRDEQHENAIDEVALPFSWRPRAALQIKAGWRPLARARAIRQGPPTRTSRSVGRSRELVHRSACGREPILSTPTLSSSGW